MATRPMGEERRLEQVELTAFAEGMAKAELENAERAMLVVFESLQRAKGHIERGQAHAMRSGYPYRRAR